MVWYGIAWYGMVWYGMVWYGMVRYGMVWYGMVRYGMVWYGMVWYGMVRYGMEANAKAERLFVCHLWDAGCWSVRTHFAFVGGSFGAAGRNQTTSQIHHKEA